MKVESFENILDRLHTKFRQLNNEEEMVKITIMIGSMDHTGRDIWNVLIEYI